MIQWFNETDTGRMVGSWVKVFLTAVLFVVMNYFLDGGTLSSMSLDNLDMWLTAGIAALLPIVINYLNPKDTRYGIKE